MPEAKGMWPFGGFGTMQPIFDSKKHFKTSDTAWTMHQWSVTNVQSWPRPYEVLNLTTEQVFHNYFRRFPRPCRPSFQQPIAIANFEAQGSPCALASLGLRVVIVLSSYSIYDPGRAIDLFLYSANNSLP